jgi:opacity protein-like surface antigen
MDMRIPATALLLGLSTTSFSQTLPQKPDPAGIISVGGRTSFSLFSDGPHGQPGTGIGGQFRVRLAERVNTDWFYDHITGPVGDHAHRTDEHIGWSVLFYLRRPDGARHFLQPYVLAGHCFDHSKQQANNDPDNAASRWSSAVQAGAGMHFQLSDRTDLSLVVQYMLHLGNDVHAEEHDGTVEFHQEAGSSLEGHLLLHLSFNYQLFDAW